MTRRPKWGQHFLADAAYRRRIAESLEVGKRDWVVEVGAGRGELTELLASRAGHVIAIELDRKLGAGLRGKFSGDDRVTIVAGDILNLDLTRLVRGAPEGKCLVFGNLPYYITSPILHRLLDAHEAIRGMALLMQREVAERVVAEPGVRDYGYLSVLVQLFSRPRILFDVPPGAFSPRPKVQSSLVEFRMSHMFPEWTRARTDCFLEFAKRCFAQKRKSLRNNLAAFYRSDRLAVALAHLRMQPAVRAEQISISQLADLFENLESC
jgi:16S rRNA (adenine1518-N6/adenine1519-N6)-dimethyltransferase